MLEKLTTDILFENLVERLKIVALTWPLFLSFSLLIPRNLFSSVATITHISEQYNKTGRTQQLSIFPRFWPIKCQYCPHIETSQLIGTANIWEQHWHVMG